MDTDGPLFRRHVSRPRLTRILDASPAAATVLVAPPGYGKTILAAEWLATRPQSSWLRATPASGDLAAFAVALGDAVETVVAGAGERLRQRVAARPAGAGAEMLADLLVPDLEPWPEAAVLAIDDYQHVAESLAADEFVGLLLERSPLRLLVTTRRRPGWCSARATLYGQILELGAEQLAMTEDEAGRVLAASPAESVRALVEQAHGWPAVIGLAALSASAEMPGARVDDALYRFFAEEVLRARPAAERRFLLAASIPPTLTPSLVAAVLESGDAARALDRLADDGLLQPADTGAYRLHPLLRTFLRREIDREDPALAHAVAERAIEHLRKAGRVDDAFEVALAAGRLEDVVAVVAEAGPGLLAGGRVETVERWLAACADEVVKRPDALLVKAELLTMQDHLTEARALALDVAARASEDETAARGWHLAGRAAHLLGEGREAIDSHRRAQALTRDAHLASEALFGAFLASIELESGEAAEYLAELERAEPGDLDTRLRIAVAKVQLGAHVGSIRGLWAVFEPLLPLADHSRDPLRKSAFLKEASALAVARAEYELARRLAGAATEVCRDLRLDFATPVCLLHRAVAEIGLRELARARRTIDECARRFAASGNPGLEVYTVNLHLRLALAQGDAVSALGFRERLPSGNLFKGEHGDHFALVALAQAASGDSVGARESAAAARSLTGGVEAKFHAAFAETIADLVDAGPTDAVARRAAALLAEAAEEDFFDTIVIAYRAYPPLLPLLAAGDLDGRLPRVLRGARDGALARRAGIDLGVREVADASELLTPRESEVLALIAEGLSNAEIARRLFISMSTAKVHVHHILEKLGARTRLEAVRQYETQSAARAASI